MQLFIMRHGEAKNFVEQGCHDDSQRALTTQGELEAKMMSSWLQKMQVTPSHVFVSPYVRAQQTCAITTSLMNTVITTVDFITPEGDAKQVHDFIDGWCSEQQTAVEQEKIEAEKSLLIISHMPLVSYLVAQLTQSVQAPIFATAGIAHIDYDSEKMHGRLIGLVSPSDLC
ncbi:phosphohistidine phosphatase SixA [Colwellia psychrerythraea]|uniref:Phosphohistidine phosphatase, SixA n=1 Tax=Colwellia psychrerythraea TaxID=28229 RepID=A0A099KCU8_COLPS|nr:phosphohistidine phosphatase SixA [Colwellia psychrerythraea]KGJ87418.1 phosphohistidine phosphatase, SixA [Colwellia psychrerythraea]